MMQISTRTRTIPKTHTIYTIAVIGFIFTLHVVIPMYSNSSFLSLFADAKTVGYIYMISAAASVLSFLTAPFFIRRLGNYKTVVLLCVTQMAVLYVLITSTSSLVIVTAFILQSVIVSLIGLCMDIFLEVYTEGSHVGAVRGLYTATLNGSWLIGPLIGTMIINGTNNFRSTYTVALFILFPLLYLIHRNFPRFKDPHYTHPSPYQLLKHVSKNHNWVKIFSANMILQTFYAWMVVYSPIYLNKTIGFNWTEIGLILVIMLLPFPTIQYPLGKLADRKYGEKEMMTLGFFIMGIATILLSFINTPNVFIWATALLLTRVGAAMVEIMIEIYFFKTVSPNDSAALGAFRITRPLAYFIAPLITIVGLSFTTNNYLFIIIGLITLLAMYPSITLKDTK